MNGFEMNFEEFEREYMSAMDGYIPTYFSSDEEFNEEGFIMINIELIAPSRMSDGPSRFFRIISVKSNPEQYLKIKEYAKKAGEFWKNHLENKSEELFNYSNKFNLINLHN